MSSSALRHVFYLGIKELASLKYDTVLILFIIYAFTYAIVASVNFSVDVRHASIAVVDEDGSQLAGRIGGAFLEPRFKKAVRLGVEEVEGGMESGRYTFILDIPPGFERDLKDGRRPRIQLNVDATAVAQAFNGAVYVQRIVDEEVERFLHIDAASQPPVVQRARVKYNPNMEDYWFLAVGELLEMVTILSLILPAAALLREQEKGTVQHLLVMPLRPAEIMLSKVWANAVVILLGSLVSVVVVIEGYLGVPLKGSLLLFLLGTLVYQFTATAVGVVISTFVASLAQFILVGLMVVAPMVFLSGVFTPVEAMPPALSHLMGLSPLLYYVRFSTAVLFRGAGLETVWPELAALALIGAGLFAVALVRFRRHFSSYSV